MGTNPVLRLRFRAGDSSRRNGISEILARGETIRVIVNGADNDRVGRRTTAGPPGMHRLQLPDPLQSRSRNVEIRSGNPGRRRSPARLDRTRKARSSVDGQEPIVESWRMHIEAWPIPPSSARTGRARRAFCRRGVDRKSRTRGDGSGPPEAFPMQWERTSNDRYAISALGVTLPNVVLSGTEPDPHHAGRVAPGENASQSKPTRSSARRFSQVPVLRNDRVGPGHDRS